MAAVVDVYTSVAEDAGMTLTADIRPVAPVLGDRNILTQALANLIENALRHCPRGTTIRCELLETRSKVVLILRDNGPGIPLAERDKVLLRFYRSEKSRTTPGTGLGLSLVKAVTDLHGAGLELGEAGPGLIVTISLDPAT